MDEEVEIRLREAEIRVNRLVRRSGEIHGQEFVARWILLAGWPQEPSLMWDHEASTPILSLEVLRNMALPPLRTEP